MNIDHHRSLKEVDVRLDKERATLIGRLAVSPPNQELPSELLGRLAVLTTVRDAVAREIASHEPRLGWGSSS